MIKDIFHVCLEVFSVYFSRNCDKKVYHFFITLFTDEIHDIYVHNMICLHIVIQ